MPPLRNHIQVLLFSGLKVILKLLALLIFVRFIIFMGEPWGGARLAKQDCRDSWRMTRMVAAINEARRLNLHTPEEQFDQLFFVPSERGGITLADIPSTDQKEDLQNVDYFLFAKESQIGVLSNGKTFYGPYDAKSLQSMKWSKDPCSRPRTQPGDY
jgi:hypothetical protein